MNAKSRQAAPAHEAAQTKKSTNTTSIGKTPALIDQRTAATEQSELVQRIDRSPRMIAQRALADSVQQSPRVHHALAATLQRKLALLAPHAGAAGVNGTAPLQRVLNRRPARSNGPNGLKDIYQDSAGGLFYRVTVGAPVGQINLIEVTLSPSPTFNYVAVPGAVARAMDIQTNNWVAPGAAPPVAVAPPAPVDWSVAQALAANFVHGAGNHYQRNEAAYLNYHVHVSAYHIAQRFAQFHVKFDAGADGYVSLFYNFGQGAVFHHYGQDLPTCRATVKDYADRALLPVQAKTTDVQADVTLGLMEARANAIAAVVIAAL